MELEKVRTNMDWGGLVFFVIFATFVALVLVGAFRVLYSPIWTRRPGRAKDILKERYARGELTEEEYRKMLADIEQ